MATEFGILSLVPPLFLADPEGTAARVQESFRTIVAERVAPVSTIGGQGARPSLPERFARC